MSVRYQPDVTVIRHEHPMWAIVLGSVVVGLLATLLVLWAASVFTANAAILCGALLCICLIALLCDGVLPHVAAAYLAPLAVPLMLVMLASQLSPPAIFTVLFPLSLLALARLSDDIICTSARIKASHYAVLLSTRETTECFLACRFGFATQEGLANWLVRRIRTVDDDQAAELAAKERDRINTFNDVASAYRITLILYGLAGVAGVALIWLSSLARFWVVFSSAFTMAAVVCGFAALSYHRLPNDRTAAFLAFRVFLRRFAEESPPYDEPTTFIPETGGGDWLQRISLAAATIVLSTSAVLIGGYLFPLFPPAPTTIERSWHDAHLFSQPNTETEAYRSHARANAGNWIHSTLQLAEHRSELPMPVLFGSFVLSIAVPLLFLSVVVGMSGGMIHFLDRQITFLPPDED